MLDKIWVKANDGPKFAGRVACHEYDTAHVTPDNPEGLLDISPCSVSDEGYEPVEVTGTPYVRECIRQGKLVQVPAPKKSRGKAAGG